MILKCCVLKNNCHNPDSCCHFCDDKKCGIRCTDDNSKCNFCISKPREWHQPWVRPKKEEIKSEVPKTLSEFSYMISKYYKEKNKFESGGSLTTHYIILNPDYRTKDGKSEITGCSLQKIISQLRKVK